MIDLLRLCRLYYALPMPLILLLTIWYASGDDMAGRWAAAAGASVALALVVAGGYVLNDVFDIEVDRVNAPNRPIAGGRVRVRTGLAWAIALLAGGLIVAAVVSRWQYPAVLAGVTALLVFYNAFSKRLGVGKQLIVAVLMTSSYPLAFAHVGDATGSRLTTLHIFPVWLFLVSFGYETLKDIRDIRGDRLVAVRPTWVQRHPRVAGRVARTTLAVGALVLFGPGFVGCGWVYWSIVPAAIVVGVAAAFLPRARAMTAIYVECVLVGIAATADIMVLGA